MAARGLLRGASSPGRPRAQQGLGRPECSGSPVPRKPRPAGRRRGGIPGDAGVMYKSETMLSVPEFYSRRKQFVGQSSTRLDQCGLRLGMWYWKDETKTLEFRSFTPAIELKEKGKKGKAVHFAELDGGASERLTDKRFASRDEKSPKALEKRGQQGNVTLDDVKFVALLSLQDTEMQRICSFTTFMRNKNLDSFLMALLYYLSYYLERLSMEKKPQSYMVGLVEKKEIELVMNKLEDAQKYLAQKYCILVLGVGMADKHHMNCGKEKISDTQKDWKFFESFYTFCTCIAWIVFRRQYLTEIEEEVGRLFRTNMFNIPRRKREDKESGGEKKRMTLVQFRRMMAKRPAIKKAMDMRSPVLSTLLPSLREKAQHIVEKKYVAGIKLQPRVEKDITSVESVAMPIVGILGEPRNLFNPHTLLPLESEENGKPSGRTSSIIERNNTRIQDTLNLVMSKLASQSTCPK